MLSPKIFHLSQDNFGLNETYQEFNQDPLFCVFCDALYLTKPEESPKIAKEFERIIKKYLSIHRHNFSEKTLKKALEEAQKHYSKQYDQKEHQLKIAVVIFFEPPKSGEGGSERYFYIAGLGDFKLFEVDKSSPLLFYDSETPKLPIDLSLKKRFQYVTNALGHTHFKGSILKLKANDLGPLLLMSYGTYNSLSEEKWIQWAADFTNKKNHLIRSLSKIKDKDHQKQLVYLSFKIEESRKQPEQPFLTKKNLSIEATTSKRVYYLLQWSFKIIFIFIIGISILELTHNYPLLSSWNQNHHEFFRGPIKEPEIHLNLRSLKTPIRFPFLKERAYFIDMKRRYEKQSLLIEKLHDQIQEQDQALRDLQLKTYHSAPLFKPHPAPVDSKNSSLKKGHSVKEKKVLLPK